MSEQLTEFYDGDFTVPIPTGDPVWFMPNKDFGDLTTLFVKQKYTIDADSYKSRGTAAIGSPCPFSPGRFLVSQEDPENKDGVYEFDRIYGVIPIPHNEYESWVFTPSPASYKSLLNNALTTKVSGMSIVEV